MNILIVSCVFLPEPVVSGKSSYSLAHYLTRNKHNVEVLAPYLSRPNKDSYPSKLLKLYHVDKDFKDFKVVRCQSFFSQKSQLLSRFIENISFGLSTSLYLLFSRKYNVIYSNTWPIFASFLITFLCIAGEGSQHNECIKIANINKPNNIFFYYPWKSNETESLLKSADILILPTLDDQALFSVPSKLISYMQSKKPIFTIANKKSDLYSIVTSSNSGWAVESNDARRVLIEAIETPKARLEKYGENAFNYGNQNFNANLNLKKLTTIITNAKKNI